jgi:chloramphenicol 3-O-phosphotransferase
MNNSSENERSFVVLLTGPAGAGKTTVAHAWASRQKRPTAHISLDDVRDFVKAGFVHPADGWKDEVEWQYHLAQQGYAMLAINYVNAGFLCIIDDAIFPEWESVGYAGWERLLAEVPHYLVVLLPEFEYVIERNKYRTGNRLLSEDMLRTIYEMMVPWKSQAVFQAIDNSQLTIDETVARLEVEIERRRAAL